MIVLVFFIVLFPFADTKNNRINILERRPDMVVPSDSTSLFVAISVSAVNKFNARGSDYLEASVLTALNWKHMGFTPIVLIITGMKPSLKAQYVKHELHKTHSIRVEIIKVPHSFVYVAQRCRLAAAHFLNATEGYLRLTDADMLVGNSKAFGAYTGGIHIFNGLCGRGEYPMHSIGMSLALWRQYFNASLCSPSILTQTLTHSGIGWTGDQQLVTRVIQEEMKMIPLSLSSHSRCRLHPNDSLSKCGPPDDVHLAGFTMKSHFEWTCDACEFFNLTSPADNIKILLGKIYNQTEKENSTVLDTHE